MDKKTLFTGIVIGACAVITAASVWMVASTRSAIVRHEEALVTHAAVLQEHETFLRPFIEQAKQQTNSK